MRAPGLALSPRSRCPPALLPRAQFQPAELLLFQPGVGSHPANAAATAPNCADPCAFRLTPSLQNQPFVPNRSCNANIYFSSPAHAFKRETTRHHLEPAGSCSRFPLALLHRSTQPLVGCFLSFPRLQDLGRLLEGRNLSRSFLCPKGCTNLPSGCPAPASIA